MIQGKVNQPVEFLLKIHDHNTTAIFMHNLKEIQLVFITEKNMHAQNLVH